MHVVQQRDARRVQPQRGQEGDAVDHLDHHVRVRDQAARLAPDGPREDRAASAEAVDRQVAQVLPGLGALV
jgi:hypothetical protein